MRKLEQRLWDRARPRLARAGIFAERVENVVGEGTPDVHTAARVDGRRFAAWLELKAVGDWPARAATPVMGSRTEVRKSQRAWHPRYAAVGGCSFILLGVGSREVFLIAGLDVRACDNWNQLEVRNWAVAASWDAVIATLRGEER